MSSPRAGGGADKCTVCGKTVYFAERKEHEKQLFHVTCFNKWWKEKTATGEGLWGGKYSGAADVSPAYYRTSDTAGGPRMESGSDYKVGGGGGASAGSKFCSNCGAAGSGGKFCQNSGAPI